LEIEEIELETVDRNGVRNTTFPTTGHYYKDSKLVAYQGNITGEAVDAIVMPITKESYENVKDIMSASFGDAVVGHEEDLPCKMVLYVIGYLEQQQKFGFPLPLVRKIIFNSLVLASKHNAKIISMSALGPGLHDRPVEEYVETTFDVIEEFLEGPNESVQEIRFVNAVHEQTSLFSNELLRRYQLTLGIYEEDD
jgi:O-acetyl-ADP-ribose deacetylase (regulator of RNase III)